MAKSRRTHRRPGRQAVRVTRTLDALPDTLDFRDKMYIPTLVEVPTSISLECYRKADVPILDQGSEGACTGFGLATVIHYLLRVRRHVPDPAPVSPWMLYQMAKRYDEWPGENYSGSSARGAMKGWYKHGVCSESLGAHIADTKKPLPSWKLTHERVLSAKDRPLGAYFRVNHKDIVAMHSAIAETRILYATSSVHEGWDAVGPDGIITLKDGTLGGHAFAIVAYDRDGFWIQNSWGRAWGMGGFARISYDDWLLNGTDVWTARLGAAINLKTPTALAVSRSAAADQSATYAFCDLRPHIISIGNNGLLRTGGTFGTSKEDVHQILTDDFNRITESWKTKRILLYAHGGLTDEESAIQRLADQRATFLDAEVYPLAFIWKTDFWSTVTNVLRDALRKRRPEGVLDDAKDFMLDRLDDALEPIARTLGGKLLWSEMKENALAATTDTSGGGSVVIDVLKNIRRQDPSLQIHMAGHSAGSILLAPMIERLTASSKGITISSCTLWAPAATTELFKKYYVPAITSAAIKRFALFTLDDHTERDDHCANIYHKSLLYLVSNAFEQTPRIPILRDGVPIVGMEKFVKADAELSALFKRPNAHWVVAPNVISQGQQSASRSRRHGDFDDDASTLQATLARILDNRANHAEFAFQRSSSSATQRRAALL